MRMRHVLITYINAIKNFLNRIFPPRKMEPSSLPKALQKNISLKTWRTNFKKELTRILKLNGFVNKGQLYWRENETYLEFFRMYANKYGRGYFIDLKVVDKKNIINESVSDVINRIHFTIYWERLGDFVYSEEFSWELYSMVISEILLIHSNNVAKKHHQEPPHILQVDNKIPCSLKPYEDLCKMQQVLELHQRRISSDFINLLIGDYGIDLPNGWKIIPRHERQPYAHQLSWKFDHDELQEFEIYPSSKHSTWRGLLQALIVCNSNLPNIKDENSFDLYYSGLCVVFAQKQDRILLLTGHPLMPIVTMELRWIGGRESSISKANPLYYDHFVSELV